MKILIHVCCAPCLTYPHKKLSEDGHDISGYFYNPNIHPYTEYRARKQAVQRYTALRSIKVHYKNDYPLEEFIRGQLGTIDNNKKRCEFCFTTRLRETARFAKENGFDAFTTTLLESKHQPHKQIRDIASELAKEWGTDFYYEDFRTGWKESISLSKEMELYRQKYCGCIFSEKERYLD